MLKLSTASATASDAVKCCLVILQAEMLGFCAVHTPAHADIAAGWCRALAHAAISLETDAAWERASRAVTGVATLMLAEFGGQYVRTLHIRLCGRFFRMQVSLDT